MASQQMGMGAQMGGQMPPLPTGAMPFQPAVSNFFLTIVYLDVLCMCSAYVFLFKYVSPRSCLCDLFQYSHTFQETMIGVSANLANATDASAHTYIQSAANNQGATKPVPRRYTQMSFGNQNQVCLLCMH
jgi:hypothetical protein